MGSALFYQPTGAAHSVLWLFGRRQKFRGWYVNLERRVHHGEDIDIADHELDINVAPDRTWQWKDEDSFAEKTGHPAYWNAEEATAIRTEGNRVARLAEAGTFPFDGSWCDFRPPPAWRTPPRPPVPRHPLLTPHDHPDLPTPPLMGAVPPPSQVSARVARWRSLPGVTLRDTQSNQTQIAHTPIRSAGQDGQAGHMYEIRVKRAAKSSYESSFISEDRG